MQFLKLPYSDKALVSLFDRFGWDVSHHFQALQLVALIYGWSLGNAMG